MERLGQDRTSQAPKDKYLTHRDAFVVLGLLQFI